MAAIVVDAEQRLARQCTASEPDKPGQAKAETDTETEAVTQDRDRHSDRDKAGQPKAEPK